MKGIHGLLLKKKARRRSSITLVLREKVVTEGSANGFETSYTF